jgi:hypothetical protein
MSRRDSEKNKKEERERGEAKKKTEEVPTQREYK